MGTIRGFFELNKYDNNEKIFVFFRTNILFISFIEKRAEV